MKPTFLEYQQPIAELENRIEELRFVQDDSAVDISEEIARLKKKSQALTRDIYSKLSAWQIALVARTGAAGATALLVAVEAAGRALMHVRTRGDVT